MLLNHCWLRLLRTEAGWGMAYRHGEAKASDTRWAPTPASQLGTNLWRGRTEGAQRLLLRLFLPNSPPALLSILLSLSPLQPLFPPSSYPLTSLVLLLSFPSLSSFLEFQGFPKRSEQRGWASVNTLFLYSQFPKLRIWGFHADTGNSQWYANESISPQLTSGHWPSAASVSGPCREKEAMTPEKPTTYFFFSLSLFRVCELPAWEPWDWSSSAAVFLCLKAFISSSRDFFLSSSFFFSSWCSFFSRSNFSCSWRRSRGSFGQFPVSGSRVGQTQGGWGLASATCRTLGP